MSDTNSIYGHGPYAPFEPLTEEEPSQDEIADANRVRLLREQGMGLCEAKRLVEFEKCCDAIDELDVSQQSKSIFKRTAGRLYGQTVPEPRGGLPPISERQLDEFFAKHGEG